MFKRLALMTMAATILSATPAYAGQWMQDGNGWWWQNDNGSYPAFTWAWCDGNHDGIGENYFFDENGYMSMDTAAQEIAVNENGAMLYNGAVCTTAMPDGQDFVPGMAIDGRLVYWVYQESDASIAAGKERESQKGMVSNNNTGITTYEHIDMKALSYYMIDLINEEREQRGKDSLVINEELMDDAALRAEESSIKFSHTRPNGKDYSTAINVDYSKVGENLVYSTFAPNTEMEEIAQQTISQWLNSEEHKRNMLKSQWDETGLAAYAGEDGCVYFAQIFIQN